MSFVLVFMNFCVWASIFSDQTIINGYSFNNIIWYTTFAETLWFSINNVSTQREISNDISTKKILVALIKPYNYIIFMCTRYIGEIFTKFILYAVVMITFCILSIGGINGFRVKNFLFIMPFLIAVFINILIRIIMCLVSFWFDLNEVLRIILDKVIMIFGVIFPIEFLPKTLQKIIFLSPVYPFIYGPSKLAINFSFNLLSEVLIMQLIYGIIIFFIVCIMYQKGVEKIVKQN